METIPYKDLSAHFIFACDEEEQRSTSWGEWRYWDNPEFAGMLLMGVEMYQ